MKGKIAKERIFYDNYCLSETYPDEDVIANMLERDDDLNAEDITDNDIWEERYLQDSYDWEEVKVMLEGYFSKCNKLICEGSVGRWNGVVSGHFYFNTFDELLSGATKDCDYFKFYDVNGHLYLHCTHHDGSCQFEIKEVTEKGYTRLLRIAEREWGCPKREYEPMTKENIVNHLNMHARSFYC